jgi:hypothetical protein
MPKALRWPAQPYLGPLGLYPPLLSRKRLDFRSASVHSLANGVGVQRKVAGVTSARKAIKGKRKSIDGCL